MFIFPPAFQFFFSLLSISVLLMCYFPCLPCFYLLFYFGNCASLCVCPVFFPDNFRSLSYCFCFVFSFYLKLRYECTVFIFCKFIKFPLLTACLSTFATSCIWNHLRIESNHINMPILNTLHLLKNKG